VTQLSWLVTRFPQKLRATEQKDVTWFCAQDPKIASAYQVVQDFRQLLHEHKEEQLLAWATTYEASGIPKIQHFLRHLRHQWASAVAAMTMQASNGQTEGHIHKLKLLKRQMYSRAGFTLL